MPVGMRSRPPGATVTLPPSSAARRSTAADPFVAYSGTRAPRVSFILTGIVIFTVLDRVDISI